MSEGLVCAACGLSANRWAFNDAGRWGQFYDRRAYVPFSLAFDLSVSRVEPLRLSSSGPGS